MIKEKEYTTYHYDSNRNNRPISASVGAKPECTISVSGSKPNPTRPSKNHSRTRTDLANCRRTVRYITLILGLVVIISFCSLIYLKSQIQ